MWCQKRTNITKSCFYHECIKINNPKQITHCFTQLYYKGRSSRRRVPFSSFSARWYVHNSRLLWLVERRPISGAACLRTDDAGNVTTSPARRGSTQRLVRYRGHRRDGVVKVNKELHILRSTISDRFTSLSRTVSCLCIYTSAQPRGFYDAEYACTLQSGMF